MLEQILKALKDKFKDLGFTDKAFGAVAAFLATTVTEEGQIEEAISGVEPLLKGFQGDADKRVTDAILKAKLEAKKEEKPEKKPQTKPPKVGEESEPEDKNSDDTPEWAKLLIEQNKELNQKILNIESGKATENRKQKIESLLKDAPESFKATVLKDFGRMKFDTEEDFESYFSDKKTDFEAFSKELTEKGLGVIGNPGGGQNLSGQPPKEASKDEVSAVLNILS